MYELPTIDCQTCGEVLIYLSDLTDYQRRDVAANPQNYIIECAACRSTR